MRNVVFAIALAGLAGGAAAQERVEQRRAVDSDATIEIENMAGSIKVVGWSKAEVEVKGTLGRGAEGLDFGGSAHRTTISVDTSSFNPHAVRSDLEIRVPAGSKLQIESFSAPITVIDVSGVVHAESVSGSISVSGAKEVDISAVQGNVEVSGATQRVHAEAVNGNVTLKDVAGQLDASTVNGLLSVAGGAFDGAQLETVSGTIRFEGALLPHAHLDVNTVSGSIRSDFGGEQVPRKHRYTSAKEQQFSTGSGGASVSIETLSGTITLRKRVSK